MLERMRYCKNNIHFHIETHTHTHTNESENKKWIFLGLNQLLIEIVSYNIRFHGKSSTLEGIKCHLSNQWFQDFSCTALNGSNYCWDCESLLYFPLFSSILMALMAQVLTLPILQNKRWRVFNNDEDGWEYTLLKNRSIVKW